MSYATPSAPEHWDAPLAFHAKETPEIQAAWLPEEWGVFAAAVAAATETPEGLSAMIALGVLSAVCSQHVVVSPKEGWQEPVNLYTLIALPPANHKSWVLRQCIAPLIAWEAAQSAAMEEKIQRERSERKTEEKIIQSLRHKAAKTSNTALQRQLIEEIAYKEIALKENPSFPVLFTSDATPEALTQLVHEQKGRLAIFSDEGGMLETLAGLYTGGNANIDILLKGIDGGELRLERKDRRITLNPYLTIVFAVQPRVIQTLGEKRAYADNGALDRFLYVLPKSNLGYRNHQTAPVTARVKEAYQARILALLDYYTQESFTPRVLTLSPEAHAAWRFFQAEVEVELRPEGKFAACLGWGGKLCGFALRIAGLLHAASSAHALDTVITLGTMQNALSLCTTLIEHALAAFDAMGNNPATLDAKILLSWIKTKKLFSFTQSELVLAMRNRKISSERLGAALHLLHTHHCISAPVKLPTRKPTTVYYVNPQLFPSQPPQRPRYKT